MRGEGQFGQFADLRGETWQNRGGEGGDDTPIHTMLLYYYA